MVENVVVIEVCGELFWQFNIRPQIMARVEMRDLKTLHIFPHIVHLHKCFHSCWLMTPLSLFECVQYVAE